MSEQVATLFVLLLGIVTVVAGILWLRLPPFLALLVGAVAVGMATPENIRRDSLSLRSDAAEIERLGGIAAIDDARGPLPKQLATAFGTMCGKIGLLIALAAVIGQAMQASGAADAIVRTVLGLVGQKRAPAALVASGFTIGIPVFFDTVFYLMIPIARSLYQRAGGNYLFYVLCIICGGTMAHSLVPPTPGPLLIAGELRVPLGMMLAAGLFFGLVTAVTGYAFASVSTRGSTLTPPVEAASANESGPLPPFSLSILPIAVPVVLLALGTTVPKDSLLLGYAPWLASLFEKNGAIGIGAVIAVAMLVRFNRTERPWPDLISDSLLSAGMIVLITGAGGAFGEMLQLSGVRQLFATLPEVSRRLLHIAAAHYHRCVSSLASSCPPSATRVPS